MILQNEIICWLEKIVWHGWLAVSINNIIEQGQLLLRYGYILSNDWLYPLPTTNTSLSKF